MTDPRVARTRGRLRAALREACAERPLDQVSVSEVVRRAGVARTTFYLHYEDLHALAVDACAEIVREAVDALHARRTLPSEPPPELAGLLSSVRAGAPLYRRLLRPGGGGPLGELLYAELAGRSLAERRARLPGSGGHELAATAVAAVFTSVLAGWLHERVPGDPDELAARIWPLLTAIHAAVRG